MRQSPSLQREIKESTDEQLLGPVCQGALLGVKHNDEFFILFSGPTDPKERRTIQIRVSADGGLTWQDGPILYEGPAAYSDLVQHSNHAIGCLYEVDGYKAIVWSTCALEALITDANAAEEK